MTNFLYIKVSAASALLKLKSLIHDQINLIKFTESNKFDNEHSKI